MALRSQGLLFSTLEPDVQELHTSPGAGFQQEHNLTLCPALSSSKKPSWNLLPLLFTTLLQPVLIPLQRLGLTLSAGKACKRCYGAQQGHITLLTQAHQPLQLSPSQQTPLLQVITPQLPVDLIKAICPPEDHHN